MINKRINRRMDNPTRSCTFCANKGIPAPHNHTIRDFSKKDAPIICPELLNITCTYCKDQGHTKKYCSLLKQKDNNTNKSMPNLYKRLGVNIEYGSSENVQREAKLRKVNVLTAAFGAIDMDI